VALHQAGDLVQAESLYRQALVSAPQSFDAHHLLGVLLAQTGRPGEARHEFDTALALRPGDATALSSIGKLLLAAGDAQGARAAYNTALVTHPGHPGLLFARGNAERALGELAAAEQSYRGTIAADPTHHHAHNNLGAVLERQGQADAALACYSRATELAPGNAEAWNNRAGLLAHLHRYADAEVSASRAVAARPAFAQAFNSRGIARWRLGRNEEALADFNQALTLDPALPGALANRAKLLWSEKRDFTGAARDLEELVRLDPAFPLARGELFYVRATGGDWRHFDTDVAALTLAVRQNQPVVEPFIFQAIATSPADLLANARLHTSREYPPRTPLAANAPHSHDKIRLGYVCGEFRGHATSYLSAGLFEHHDQAGFEVIAFDNGAGDDSPTRTRLEAAFDRIIPIAGMSDLAAAQRIRAEEIDILINLNGYYGAHRMGVFAHRPAPLQVNWLGFPGTLGADYMDYIIADRVVLPEAEQCFFSEKPVWLPHSYQVNDDRRAIAARTPARAECGLPTDAFVFCNFNQSYKLSPAMLQTWLRILARVPHSVLWLWAGHDGHGVRVKQFAADHGIDAARIVIAPPVPGEDHLARLKLADLFLDSLPYNAHTTASDALWVGLPLLTQTGTTFAGRVATSLLQALDLPELVTASQQDYENRAVELAQDVPRLNALRARLAANRTTTPLFNTALFCRHLEAACKDMWQHYIAGDAPKPFAVAPRI
jgi:predicted O-linked N-acetylglucosamine transferase (SPINDLY family)